MRQTVRMFVVVAMAVSCVGAPVHAAATPTPDRAYADAVIDGLVAGGLLTAQQAAAMKDNAQAAADAASAAQPAPEEPKEQWYDTVKVSGYVQGRWQEYPDKTKQPGNEFLIRRGRVKVTAEPAPGLQIVVQPDFGEGEVCRRNVIVSGCCQVEMSGWVVSRTGTDVSTHESDRARSTEGDRAGSARSAHPGEGR